GSTVVGKQVMPVSHGGKLYGFNVDVTLAQHDATGAITLIWDGLEAFGPTGTYLGDFSLPSHPPFQNCSGGGAPSGHTPPIRNLPLYVSLVALLGACRPAAPEQPVVEPTSGITPPAPVDRPASLPGPGDHHVFKVDDAAGLQQALKVV